jgi:hypothetical protein
MKNKYQLSRNIPTATKLEIRKRSWFGCVMCGCGVTEYEHVNPEFHEAKVHDPNCMTLLCSNHHTLKTKKLLSVQAIQKAMLNPYCKTNGFASSFFDSPMDDPMFTFGNNVFKGLSFPISIHGKPILKVTKPELEGECFKISGTFYDSLGNPSLEIIDNEWKVYSNVWDFDQVANRILIRENKLKTCLELESLPPNRIGINILDLNHQKYKIRVVKNELLINHFKFNDSNFSDGTFGIYLD